MMPLIELPEVECTELEEFSDLVPGPSYREE